MLGGEGLKYENRRWSGQILIEDLLIFGRRRGSNRNDQKELHVIANDCDLPKLKAQDE